LVMTKGVKVGVVRGPDTHRRSAAKHAKFSKWDGEFMLPPSRSWVGSGVGSERRLISRRPSWFRRIWDKAKEGPGSVGWMVLQRPGLGRSRGRRSTGGEA